MFKIQLEKGERRAARGTSQDNDEWQDREEARGKRQNSIWGIVENSNTWGQRQEVKGEKREARGETKEVRGSVRGRRRESGELVGESRG
jgi:hypothetical protein